MITIVDYGVGNIASVQKAFEFIGHSVLVTTDRQAIVDAEFLVVPGQGACAQAMAQLKKLDLIGPIKDHVLANRPFLGICLGFQILFEYSEEHGGVDALNLFPGHVELFPSASHKVPQMGWNTLTIQDLHQTKLPSVQQESHVYFIHSFFVKDTRPDIVATRTHYGQDYVSAIRSGNVWGTQFHPEKSGDVGLSMLRDITD
jgi:imidazole glycerol-phosphate synthase subunit HisH